MVSNRTFLSDGNRALERAPPQTSRTMRPRSALRRRTGDETREARGRDRGPPTKTSVAALPSDTATRNVRSCSDQSSRTSMPSLVRAVEFARECRAGQRVLIASREDHGSQCLSSVTRCYRGLAPNRPAEKPGSCAAQRAAQAPASSRAACSTICVSPTQRDHHPPPRLLTVGGGAASQPGRDPRRAGRRAPGSSSALPAAN